MKRAVLLIMLCALLVSSYLFIKGSFVSFVTLKLYKDALQKIVSEQYFLSVVTYMFLYCGGVTLALPITKLFTLVGGFLFGTVAGTAYAVLSGTVGATLSFLLVRAGFGAWIQEHYQSTLIMLNKELMLRGFFYLLALRMIVVIPFFVINVIAGLTRMPVGEFIVATIIGMVPGSLIFANAGENLAALEKPSDVLSAQVLGAFFLVGLCALLPLFFQKRKS